MLCLGVDNCQFRCTIIYIERTNSLTQNRDVPSGAPYFIS
ncbi:hypothetical protein QGX15_gp174 [Pseudomonas phage psageK4e]|uniref:Uncharacterized protein n=1 Tax=Pseudomonas phage psageK4e TaxID=2875723 RepID=A0AAE9BSR1_9CAUD|nr:hypothetical protein QGX15_gp174 [Pseudomonas phage psageK4e]UAW53521.1 hypothetical protein psageK4e_073 [Pseudomonas phage psageK4e]